MKPQPVWMFWGALGVLGLILVAEWLPGGAPPVVKVPAAPSLAKGDADAPERDTAQWADAVNARPLFTIGRQPRHEAGNAHVVSATGLPRLSGILISSAGRRAIFMPDAGKPVTVAEGGTLDDSTVRRILPDRVILSGPKGDVTLTLSFDKLHAFVSGAAPANPVFPTGLFNPNGVAPNLPFPNPVRVPQFGQQQPPFQPPPPPPQPASNDSGDDDGPGDSQAQPAHAPPIAQIHPNLPRERE